MSSIVAASSFTANLFKSTIAYGLFGWNKLSHSGDTDTADESLTFLSDPVILSELRTFLKDGDKLNRLSDDAVVKICRQVEFFYTEGNLNQEEMVSLTKSLVDQSLWYLPLMDKAASPEPEISACKVPKVRFGKTELNISIVTCGGMRLQFSWMPDTVPIAPNRTTVLDSAPQQNLKNCIKSCLAIGINHFETARFYGSSEYQFVEALHELMQEGVMKREDFIFQTKLIPRKEEKFLKLWNATWDNVGEKLGYIDLLGIHAVHKINRALEESIAVCERLKREGKIRHIGFSTHGTSEQIMNLINTEKFEYINIHEHFFGSYHGSGTPDTLGGEGNLACVKRALELDMGVFQISPVDKGGKLFRPSKDCALTIGKDLTPIGLALLHGWKNIGFHTASIGIHGQSDLDEVMGAVKMMALSNQGKIDLQNILDGATGRLESRAENKLGKEWMEKGLLNLPSCFDEATDGIALGHILWMYNLLECYGMYEYCHDRYISLVGTQWNKKKSFKENADAMPAANVGRSYDESIDLTKALENHYNPSLALERIKKVHEWLSPSEPMSDEEIEKRGWKKGYNLTVWDDMPGILDSRATKNIVLQNLTGGRMGIVGTGPGNLVKSGALQFREVISKE
eukprot:CAMPEP_0195538964 /NCGR_PEP_ID=MMETSP0794_2-20130614/49805_1 /TAXON_ID=515487 /ORGANISM="Stephanopyxis turris, Strain CCMP 815" /LENGTH=626 /DNA_ID=CAMNT_0040672975 /DNA_START=47 /DNA_END=1927 /DNA_ORIENTATION=-